MLKVADLTLKVNGKAVFPVWNVGLHLREGERLAVVGESGGGKTSLAWALLGMPLPGQSMVAGSIRFDGRDLLALSDAERARLYYCSLSLVPQNAQSVFHPTRRLWQSAGEVLAKGSGGRLAYEEILQRVTPLSETLDLPAAFWHHYPHQLSGGQKQRMNLVLALINNPRMVILDEPSNALDELARSRLHGFLDAWARAHATSMAVFTHDIGMAASWADRMLVLYRGEVVEELPADQIANPYHPYTQGLMNAVIRLGDAASSRPDIPGYAVPRTGLLEGCGFFERCPKARPCCRREAPQLHPKGDGMLRCLE